MLYLFLVQFADSSIFFNVFRYITVRSALAGSTAFIFCLVLGPSLIRKLKVMSYGQAIREEGPESHQKKAGTPTMGGVLILGAVLLSTVLWVDINNSFVWLQLFAMTGFGLVGFVDDFAKVTKKQNLGLSARGKMALLLLIAGIAAGWMMYLARLGFFHTELYFPFFKELHPELGWFFLPFAMFILIGASNAVNLTDGLDGLAIGSSGIAFATYTLIAYLAGHAKIAGYLDIPHILPAAELTVFGAAMCGACMGFLWHNAHPADVFMGDTGALALGGALACMALLTGHPILLAIVGGLFVIETVSVIMQVGSYKVRRKRIFLMAPIHHHFELKGWHESKVIIRFWIFSILLAILALSTFKLR